MKLSAHLVTRRAQYAVLILAVFWAVIAISALRQNNLKMVELRSAVYAADERAGNVEYALTELRTFVYAHMNTSLTTANTIKPPIQLKYQYDRLVTAEKKRVAEQNAAVYADAQSYCINRPEADATGIACFDSYVATHGTKERPIPESLYKFDFISPSWSPDVAGWSIILAALSFTVFLIITLFARFTKNKINKT